MNYIIGISGCNGGNAGPNNIYNILKLKCPDRVILYDTEPFDELINIKYINEIINKKINENNNNTFTLLGYSMGGTIALISGIKFNDHVKKIIFLSSQTIGFEQINKLNCELIFIHSINDEIVPFKYIYKWIDIYKSNKKIYLLNSDHNWENVNIISLIKKLQII